MYRPDSYYVTKNLAEMPIFVLLPIFVGCINYYMIGFNKDVDAFLYLIVVGIVISSIGVSYGSFLFTSRFCHLLLKHFIVVHRILYIVFVQQHRPRPLRWTADHHSTAAPGRLLPQQQVSFKRFKNPF